MIKWIKKWLNGSVVNEKAKKTKRHRRSRYEYDMLEKAIRIEFKHYPDKKAKEVALSYGVSIPYVSKIKNNILKGN